MTDQQDRPATLRRAPRPAPDDNIDPIDPAPTAQPASAPTVTPASSSVIANSEPDTIATGRPGRPRRREITMPFSTRVRVDTVDLIDQIVAREGLTQRAVVEQAIWATWGQQNN